MTVRLVAALLLGTMAGNAADIAAVRSERIAVIVSGASAAADISPADLRRVYLGSITRWPDGTRIIPVVPDPDTREGQLFLKRVVQMSDIDYAQHWIAQVFRGQSSAPPHVVHSDAEARQYVAAHPAAIALVHADAVDTSVRVLTVNGKSPSAADYALAW